MVGHTLTYILPKFEVNRTNSSQDISTFVSSPCFSQSDHCQTIQHLRHGLRTNSTVTDYPVCLGHSRCHCQCTNCQNSIHQPAHLWLGLTRCLSLLLHILAYPGELAPPQPPPTGQQGPPHVCLCSPGNQIPGDACTTDAYQQ